MNPIQITRKDFLSKSIVIAPALFLTPALLIANQKEKPLAIDPAIVKEFVRVAHSDFNQLKKMLNEYPLLLNASWDWGGGDFETALNAAGHMGLKETANYLLLKGARVDIFVLTMLGKTELVKSTIKEFPSLLNSLGPHGFTLLHHAEKGGKDSEDLLAFFQSSGIKEKNISLY